MANVTAAFQRMQAELADLGPFKLPLFPEPEDFIDAKRHMQDVAIIMDAYFHELGFDLRGNSNSSVDIDAFKGIVLGALDGPEYNYDRAAEACEGPAPKLDRDTPNNDMMRAI